MDTLRKKTPEEVALDLQRIKTHMPETYRAIQQKAAQIGNGAFALVRRGCAGEPNAFYAFESGHVVGTPFNLPDIARDVAQYMVTFGVDHAVVWPEYTVQQGAAA